MSVIVLEKHQRPDGSYAVTLSDHPVRFTVIVPQSTAESDDALHLYQIMANHKRAEHAELSAVIETARVI